MANIIGTTGDDTLSGTSGGDTITGLGGNDALYDDQGGNDSLDGGDGDDHLSIYRTVTSQPAVSTVSLVGGAGNDTLYVLANWPGQDVFATLDGGSGDDTATLIGLVTATVSMGDGNDLLILMSPTAATISLGAGSDTVRIIDSAGGILPYSSYAISDFAAGVGGDNLDFGWENGSWFQSVSIGWDQSNPFGSSGYMRLHQSGTDTLVQADVDGGANDWVTFFTLANVNATSLVAANLGGYAPDGSPPAGIVINGTVDGELLKGTIGSDTISGFDGNDAIFAGAGADLVFGGFGDDFIDGGGQTDTLNGDKGADTILLSGDDTANGGTGNDILEVSPDIASNTNAIANGGDDQDQINATLDAAKGQRATLSGGNGADVIVLTGGTASAISGDAGDDAITLFRSAADGAFTITLNGGEGADSITYQDDHLGLIAIDTGSGNDLVVLGGSSGALTIELGTGSDEIRLAFGSNDNFAARPITVTGFTEGTGGDRFTIVPWLDTLLTNWDHSTNPFGTGHLRIRKAGADTLFEVDANGGGDSYVLFATLVGVATNALNGFNFQGFDPKGTVPAGQTINGTPDDDFLVGSAGADTINGLEGNDRIYGGTGNDTINGGSAGGDHVFGEGGDDQITVGAYSSANGGYGNDTLTGSGINASLYGDDGDDILISGGSESYGSVLDGGLGFDTVTGTAMSEIIVVSDSDIIDGGGGQDVVHFDLRQAGVGMTVDLTNIWTGGIGTLGIGTIQRIAMIGQTFYATSFNDNVTIGNYNPFSNLFIYAGAGNDTINGSVANDTIEGEDGDDTLRGLLGDDTLMGGAGNDTLTGGDGNDLLAGGDGDDQIDGGDGNDSLVGGKGSDTISGGANDDTIQVSGTGSSANGGSGTDLIVVEAEASADGGSGADTLRLVLWALDHGITLDFTAFWSGGPITLGVYTFTGFEFFHEIQGTTFDDVFILGPGAGAPLSVRAYGGNDQLFGSAGQDFLYGDDGDDTVIGNGGNDGLWGGTGTNLLIGGIGDDSYNIESLTDTVTENPGEGIDRIATFLAAFTLPANVENLSAIGLPGFSGTGNALDNEIVGTEGGSDTLVGLDGNDHLIGGVFFDSAPDTMIGGPGDDVYEVMNSQSIVIENPNEGTDRVETRASSFTLPENVENLTYLFSGRFTGIGNSGSNVITGSNGSDWLYGGGGNDTLIGSGGFDQLYGEAGNDRLIVAAFGSGTSVDGGADSDTLIVSGVLTLGTLAGLEAIELVGGASLTLTSTQFFYGFYNPIAQVGMASVSGTGSLVFNMDFNPVTSALYLTSLSFVPGSSVTLTINGTRGLDAIKGAPGVSNTINGGDEADQIRGGSRADTIDGGNGNDKLFGWSGADVLTGGAGSDQFRYFFATDSGLGAAADRITDFQIGTDRFNFVIIDADPVTPDDQAFTFLGTGAFTSPGTGQIRFQDSGADLLVQVDVDGNGTVDMEVVLQGLAGQVLTSADFML